MPPAMPRHRRPEAQIRQADTERAIRSSREMLAPSKAALAGSSEAQPTVILELAPRDHAVAVWTREAGGEPVYKIVRRGIKAGSTARVNARQLRGEPR